jgi:hypothetical protein
MHRLCVGLFCVFSLLYHTELDCKDDGCNNSKGTYKGNNPIVLPPVTVAGVLCDYNA